MIPKLFHRRQIESAGLLPKTFNYELTERVKKQLELILSSFGFRGNPQAIFVIYRVISQEFPEIISMQYGYYNRIDFNADTKIKCDQIIAFFHCSNTDISLSILEILCTCYSDAVDSVNERLQYEGFGYQYNKQTKRIIKLEDETFYEQCTIKTMGILAKKEYTDTLSHYTRAYDALAKQKFDDALVSIGRAMESLIKTRLDKGKINYPENATLSPLLNLIFSHIDKDTTEYNCEHIKQCILDAGRARNSIGGHGHSQGESPKVDDVFVRFIINQAAANLLFLAEVNITATQKTV